MITMMRPTTVCLACALVNLLGTAIGAQQQSQSTGPRFGILVGINRSTLEGSDSRGGQARTGMTGGVGFVFPFSPLLLLQPELLFSTKGELEADPGGTPGLKMNYIELPILLRLDLPKAGDVKPFLYAGPAPAYRLSCDVEWSNGGTALSMTCREILNDRNRYNMIDVGLVAGGGLSFDLARRRLTMGVRYNLGFGRIIEDVAFKHRVLSFAGGFEWPLRAKR